MNTLILLASGLGTRTNLGYNKVFYKIKDKTLLEIILIKFIKSKLFDDIIITYRSNKELEEIEKITSKISYELSLNSIPFQYILGGNERQNSVYNGMKYAKNEIVYIHDGARPFLSINKIKELNKFIKDNIEFNCFALAIPVIDTINIIENGEIKEILSREKLYKMQTPQVVRKKKYLDVYNSNKLYTDESSLFKNNQEPVKILHGEIQNFKVTTSEDIERIKNYD